MEKKIFISEFEAEERLKDRNSFSLPSLSFFSKRNDTLIEGMDGLAITMADDGDILVTRKRLPEEYLAYWRDNICDVDNFSPESDGRGREEHSERYSIYELLQNDPEVSKLLKSGTIVNYALVPEFYEMCDVSGIENHEPDLNTVLKINSKAYSNSLKIKLDLPAKGINVRSVEEFTETAEKMLKEYDKVLIKDSMGVSGKGILPIDSLDSVQRLSAHFRKQEEQGRTGFDFVLEPLLNKTMDFSCQFHIKPEGEVIIDGYQKNHSKGYAYLSSGPLEKEESELIEASGYRQCIMKIAEEIFKDGYYGPACVDSMIVDENTVIPLVEINPRMSMGRFNLRLEKYLGKKSRLAYVEGMRNEGYGFDKLLEDLREKKILYERQNPTGVIPLAPCTWCMDECKGQRVRIYFAIIYETDEEYKEIYDTWLGHCSGSICTGPVA